MSSIVDAVQPFVCGMIGGVTGTCFTQPIDFIKTQQQLAGEGTRLGTQPSALELTRRVVSQKGFCTLYTGIGAAIARQILYGSVRLGLYRTFSNYLQTYNFTSPSLNFSLSIGSALAAGAVAAFVGNPADLALVRMQADSALIPEAQRRYAGVGDAVFRIVKEEGVLALWKGSSPTVLRAMAMNVGMLATADQTKAALAPLLGGTRSVATLFVSSFIAGMTASFVSLPFDMLKTRLQKQRPLPDGSMPYSGLVDCAMQIMNKEGPLAFYKGIGTFILRIAPHSFIALVVMDLTSAAIDTWKLTFLSAASPYALPPPASLVPADPAVVSPLNTEAEPSSLQHYAFVLAVFVLVSFAYLVLVGCRGSVRRASERHSTSDFAGTDACSRGRASGALRVDSPSILVDESAV